VVTNFCLCAYTLRGTLAGLLMNHIDQIVALIGAYNGDAIAQRYRNIMLPDPDLLISAGEAVAANIELQVGDCVKLSATWAYVLNEYYAIPAVVVVGDLYIGSHPVFVCQDAPCQSQRCHHVRRHWQGHCWVEVGGIYWRYFVDRYGRIAG